MKDSKKINLEDGGKLEFDLNDGTIRFYNQDEEFEFKFTPDSPEYKLCKDEYFPGVEVYDSGIEFNPYSDIPMIYTDNLFNLTNYELQSIPSLKEVSIE